jgi:hypothetical protein
VSEPFNSLYEACSSEFGVSEQHHSCRLVETNGSAETATNNERLESFNLGASMCDSKTGRFVDSDLNLKRFHSVIIEASDDFREGADFEPSMGNLKTENF